MKMLPRLNAVGITTALTTLAPRAAAQSTKIKFTLDWKIQTRTWAGSTTPTTDPTSTAMASWFPSSSSRNGRRRSPEAAEIGMGDVKDDRLTRSIVRLNESYGLPRNPAPTEVFNRSFLPPKADRMVTGKF